VGVTASALASRGLRAAADDALHAAAEAHAGAEARWYEQGRLLLALAAAAPMNELSRRVSRDTMPGGILLRALSAASRADASGVAARLDSITTLPAPSRRRLGSGPEMAEAILALRSARPAETVRLLAPAARGGENDGTNLDRVSSLSLRLLTADAYAAAGALDSAAAMGTLALESVRMPPGMLALRGVACAFAASRVNGWRARGGGRPLNVPGCVPAPVTSSTGRAP
nr:hypothetical protein [Gemmatimonadales bacterium]